MTGVYYYLTLLDYLMLTYNLSKSSITEIAPARRV